MPLPQLDQHDMPGLHGTVSHSVCRPVLSGFRVRVFGQAVQNE